jgi:outer membrane protein TolC
MNAGGQMESIRTSEKGFTLGAPRQERMAGLVYGDLSWELDFFGRIRRATEAARAEFFASEENRKFVIQTLVSDLARAYIELRPWTSSSRSATAPSRCGKNPSPW